MGGGGARSNVALKRRGFFKIERGGGEVSRGKLVYKRTKERILTLQ